MHTRSAPIAAIFLTAVLLTGCFRPATDALPSEPITDETDTHANTSAEEATSDITPPDTAPPETVPFDTTPPETTPPETTPPETTPPETTPPETTPPETTPPETETETEPMPPAGTDAPSYTTTVGADGCTYIDGILIVNKTYPLPQSYAPGRDEDAFLALCRMFNDAKAAGYSLKVASSYRSYADQRYIYNGYVAQNGQAAADTFSARPGHSEHQTGLAFDLNHPDSNVLLQSFGDSAAGKWIADNCHLYGFIIRYPKGKEHITGYMYEPWHVRYLGIEKATEIFESGLCLEEFYGITSVYS